MLLLPIKKKSFSVALCFNKIWDYVKVGSWIWTKKHTRLVHTSSKSIKNQEFSNSFLYLFHQVRKCNTITLINNIKNINIGKQYLKIVLGNENGKQCLLWKEFLPDDGRSKLKRCIENHAVHNYLNKDAGYWQPLWSSRAEGPRT